MGGGGGGTRGERRKRRGKKSALFTNNRILKCQLSVIANYGQSITVGWMAETEIKVDQYI